MNYRNMGKTGLRLSEVALGSWLTAGNAIEREIAIATIRRAVELGVNYFDCADVYAQRRAEVVTAEALEPFRREDYVLASKCFFPASANELDRGLSRQHIFTSIHKTLKNFRSDYVDLFYCHRWDDTTPLEETLRAFEDLIRQGKVLYMGVSEWSAYQIESAVRIAGDIGGYAPRVNQPNYSLLQRDIESNGVLDTCRQFGVGLAVFSPLAQGMLTGKYRGGKIPLDSRLADDKQNTFIKNRMTEENAQRVEKIAVIADKAGVPMSQLALAWCLRRPELTTVIVGASKVKQIEDNVKAAEVELSRDVMDALDAIG